MSTAQHTPGPWRIERGEVWDAEGECVGVIYRTEAWTSGEEVETSDQANACLIAASPALKDGCNALLGLIQLVLGRDDLSDELRAVFTSNHRIAEAEAAVAKAVQPTLQGVQS